MNRGYAVINHLAKACFVQGLVNEIIQTIVRAKGELVAETRHYKNSQQCCLLQKEASRNKV
jgi:hypothetical protein